MRRSTIALALFATLTSTALAAGNGDKVSKAYPYGETGTFQTFVTESFQVAGDKDPQQAAHKFFTYMGPAIPAMMDAAKPKLAAIKDPKKRALAEVALCADLHKAIKKQIPRFSLDRGFEFYNTVKLGERQCYLQSIVVAGLLQRAGVPAGVAMVFMNQTGFHSNNGHAVPIARLADGTDILVDCSDPEPFMTHQGLMVSIPSAHGFAYVNPVYDASHRILAYKNLRNGGQQIPPSSVATLDLNFVRSQFDYYRGERTLGGMFTPDGKNFNTPGGLAQSEVWLKKSVTECPQNPLAVYMLGKVQEKRKEVAAANKQYLAAYTLYSQYGWIPKEEASIVAAIKGHPVATSLTGRAKAFLAGIIRR